MPEDVPAAQPSEEARGQAALLLVEALIHALVERGVLTVADAIGIVGTAMEVQHDVAEAADGSAAKMRQSYALLAAIARSFGHDLAGGETLP